MPNSDFVEKLRVLVEVYEHLMGEPGTSKAHLDALLADPDTATPHECDGPRSGANDEYLAVLLLVRRDPKQYGVLVTAQISN